MKAYLKRIKILHLMIFVAVMGFSVRLIDVAQGVTGLMNAAQAETKPAAEEAPAEKAAETSPAAGDPPPAAKAEASDVAAPSQDGLAETGAAIAPAKDGGTIDDAMIFEDEENTDKWRDANDSDASYSNIRMELFQDLAERRKEIEAREQEMSTREALLKAAEREIDQKYQELSQLRGEIEKLLEKQSEEEQARMQSLVKIYEGMKAKEAARIFDTLDLDILVSVMSKMSERKLSPVLAAMNPERARTVTILLAQEKQLPSLPGQELPSN
jgi:flagellar motility protein MotE (MotC chaperone)